MTITWLDLETFSTIPIKHGVHRYAERAEIMLFAYAFDDGPVNLWDVTQDDTPPDDLVAALTDPATLITAHNSAFDRTILRHCLPDLCPPIERWRDTMVMALAHSLPAGLGQLCEVLRIPTDQAKDKAGKRLIQLFCQPRPKNVKLRRATAETHPIEWSRFCDYAKTDIEAMRECYKRVPVWNSTQAELDLWHLDQHINDRGVAIDLDLARAAVRATDREQARLADLTHEMTEGAVAAATQRDALLRHILATYGIDLPDLQKATVERLLASDQLPQPVIDLLSIRLSASSTSTAKYQKIMEYASSDGRLRGLLQFDGASRTGRWCLAEGSLVTVLEPSGLISEKPIELVLPDDQVWDGNEWVAHEGVVFSGIKECIDHDGISASRDHYVYIDSGTKVTLSAAKNLNIPLWRGNVLDL